MSIPEYKHEQTEDFILDDEVPGYEPDTIDKSKMTPAERTYYEELQKKYSQES